MVLLDDAVTHFTERILRRPADDCAYACRARAWERLGRPADAVADYDNAVRSNPRCALWHHRRALLHRSRALLHYSSDEYGEAWRDVHYALAIDPANASYRVSRARMWLITATPEKALDDLDEAIKLEPANALAFELRAVTWASRGEYQKAIADCDEAMRLGSTGGGLQPWVCLLGCRTIRRGDSRLQRGH